jgi:UDP-glucose 4-epimerase
MKILVTGAAGLIGSHLVDLLLEQNHFVTGLDDMSAGNPLNLKDAFKNDNFNFIENKVQNFLFLSDGFDVIFHLASLKKPFNSVIPSSKVLEDNYDMTRMVVEQSLKYKSKLIFTSTSDIYGNSKLFNEDDPITIGPPTNERYSYALSKLYSEQHILNQSQQSGLNASIARIFGCSSWRASKKWSGGHIPIFCDKAIKGEDIIIHGDGFQTRSISHALDIAKGLTQIMNNFESCSGEIINLGTDEQTTVKEVAEYIVDKSNSKSKIIFIPREQIFGDYREILIRYANTNKAKKLINYSVNYSTREVIDQILNKFSDENSSYYSC